MEIVFGEEGSVEELGRILRQMDDKDGVTGMMILACSASEFTPAQVDPILRSISKPLVGGVFPAIISGENRHERGLLVIGFSSRMHATSIDQLSFEDTDVEEQLLSGLPEGADLPAHLVFVDGFTQRIGELTRSLFDAFGHGHRAIGGGAGSLDFVQRPCVFTNKGLRVDCAAVAALGTDASLGVAHGYIGVGGPYRVTESEGNTIRSLNWKPAYETYRQVVEQHSHKSFDDHEFFDLAKAYPFGIARLDAERVVRDPISVSEEGELVCVGEVPEGSHVDILVGSKPSLIAAATEARTIADQASRGENGAYLFIDCISRVLFLEDDFDMELKAVSTGERAVFGACTIGEIASGGAEFVEFYNKTAVVARFNEGAVHSE